MTVTELRKNIFKVFDQVQKTGKPVEVSRKGVKFLIGPVPTKKTRINKFDNWEPRNTIIGNPDEIIAMTPWDEKNWKETEVIDEVLKIDKKK